MLLLQDLKEKKLVEEAENGKDAPANGKVVRIQNFTFRFRMPPGMSTGLICVDAFLIEIRLSLISLKILAL